MDVVAREGDMRLDEEMVLEEIMMAEVSEASQSAAAASMSSCI